MKLNKTLLWACTFVMGVVGTSLHAETNYPERPINLTVPFGAGGVTDLTARTFGKYMADVLGKPVVVENRSGAAASIGANYVAKSKPDGYTLLLGTNVTHAITPQMMVKPPYNPLTDFQPIAMFGLNGNVLLVRPEFPANTFEDFLEHIKKQKGDLNYASGSIGSSAHLAAELLKMKVEGLNYTHIPYSSPSEAMSALIGGHVEFLFSNIGAAVTQTRSGKVKALAVTTAQRMSEMPDVPTIAESGVPDFEVVGWLAAFAPKGTPEDIIQRLSKVINDIQKNPDLRKTMDTASIIPVVYTPGELQQFVDSEYKKWGEVIKTAEIPKMQ